MRAFTRVNACICVCAFVFALVVQLIFAVHHRLPGTARAQMLLTPSALSYSSFVRFPLGVLLFNQAFDPVLRGSFSCETRPCRSQLTTRILNGASCSMTNELFVYTKRMCCLETNTGTETGRRWLTVKQAQHPNALGLFNLSLINHICESMDGTWTVLI